MQGDTLDLLCSRHLGTTAGGVVEATLKLNPGLADLGPILPVGTLVHLAPLSTASATAQTVALWE
jgi:phage tail protein X